MALQPIGSIAPMSKAERKNRAISFNGTDADRAAANEAARRRDTTTGKLMRAALIAYIGEAEFTELVAFFAGGRSQKNG